MDYKLYPIPLADINRPVYYMVKSYMMHKISADVPTDELEEEWCRLKVDTKYGDYLVFPSEDLSQQYDSETLQHEVVIIKNHSVTRTYVNGVLQEEPVRNDPFDDLFDDDDEEPDKIETVFEPHETHYYIDIDPDTHEYRLQTASDAFPIEPAPWVINNTDALRQAINTLLPVIHEAHLSEGMWEERLQTTAEMIDARVNELHILHNGGLYDNHVLGNLLRRSSLSGSRWKQPFCNYVSQLKIFTMHTAKLSWDQYGSLETQDEHKKTPQFIVEKREQERLRRQGRGLSTEE